MTPMSLLLKLGTVANVTESLSFAAQFCHLCRQQKAVTVPSAEVCGCWVLDPDHALNCQLVTIRAGLLSG